MKFPLKSAVAALALFAAMPAIAATQIAGGCSATTPDPDADACAAFEGNLNSNSNEADLNAALDILVGGDFDDVVFLDLEGTKDEITLNGEVITFDEALVGDVILSLHFGDAGSGLGDHTILYLFSFETPTSSIDLNQGGFSNGLIIGNPVPEPSTWAMMLLGFGAVGYAMRRRRKTLLPQLA